MNLNKQRGVSLSGVVVVMVVLALVGLVGAKMVPAYVDYFNIKKVFAAMEGAGELKNLGSKELRMSYSKRASIDNISSIGAEDLIINKGSDGDMVMSVEYTVKTPLFANVSLMVDFKASTAKSD
ncbi:MAG: DUF4845 domain-containing protein [Sulfuricella sp.]|nr:DUF4845 domain-containing protein [Sulfuricella sp.]